MELQSRSTQFWVCAADIYTIYELRAGFFKDDGEGEAMWEKQHELRAQKVYSLCFELGGIFINVGVLCFLFFCAFLPFNYLHPRSIIFLMIGRSCNYIVLINVMCLTA